VLLKTPVHPERQFEVDPFPDSVTRPKAEGDHSREYRKTYNSEPRSIAVRATVREEMGKQGDYRDEQSHANHYPNDHLGNIAYVDKTDHPALS
jgi:hypothetical protein